MSHSPASIIVMEDRFHLGVFLITLLLTRPFARVIEVQLTRSVGADRERRNELLEIGPLARRACGRLVSGRSVRQADEELEGGTARSTFEVVNRHDSPAVCVLTSSLSEGHSAP